MSKKISNSIMFLLSEYERLIKKKENFKLSESENETLKKLLKFLGKNK